MVCVRGRGGVGEGLVYLRYSGGNLGDKTCCAHPLSHSVARLEERIDKDRDTQREI